MGLNGVNSSSPQPNSPVEQTQRQPTTGKQFQVASSKAAVDTTTPTTTDTTTTDTTTPAKDPNLMHDPEFVRGQNQMIFSQINKEAQAHDKRISDIRKNADANK